MIVLLEYNNLIIFYVGIVILQQEIKLLIILPIML